MRQGWESVLPRESPLCTAGACSWGDPSEAGEHTLLGHPCQERGSGGLCMPVSVTRLKAASGGTGSLASLVCHAAYRIDLEVGESLELEKTSVWRMLKRQGLSIRGRHQ